MSDATLVRKPKIGLIWAESMDRVIGKNGKIPWHIPEDLQYFKKVTGNDPVIMGRNTWKSLPASVRPLPGRRNIVLSSNPSYSLGDTEVYSSLDKAITACSNEDTVWIIGGTKLYAEAIKIANVLMVTQVMATVLDGDAFAPHIDARKWYEREKTELFFSESKPTPLAYRHSRLDRIPLLY